MRLRFLVVPGRAAALALLGLLAVAPLGGCGGSSVPPTGTQVGPPKGLDQSTNSMEEYMKKQQAQTKK